MGASFLKLILSTDKDCYYVIELTEMVLRSDNFFIIAFIIRMLLLRNY